MKHSVEVQTTAPDGFKLPLCGLNPLPGQFLVSVDSLHGSSQSSKTQVQSLRRQVLSHPAELKVF